MYRNVYLGMHGPQVQYVRKTLLGTGTVEDPEKGETKMVRMWDLGRRRRATIRPTNTPKPTGARTPPTPFSDQ